MYNWSVDVDKIKKNPEKYDRFVLEQRINFGLNNQKLSAKALKKYWELINIDSKKRSFLKKILWPQS